MADGLTDSKIYVDSTGGTITFTVVSDPTPPEVVISEWKSWAYPAISGTVISDTCQIIVEPNEDVHPRDGSIILHAHKQIHDDEYDGYAFASSAYTIHQQPQIKEPEIQSLTYNIKPFKSGANANTLDVVFANKETEQLIIVDSNTWNITDFPKEQWEPIGIVVIPGNHGVLKDGSGAVNQCGVMSLVGMDFSTPVVGARDEIAAFFKEYIVWGNSDVDITNKSDNLGRYDSITDGLLNYLHSVTTNGNGSNIANGYNSLFSSAFLPRQESVGGKAKRENYPYAPSPYNGEDYNSGGYNESYGLKDGVVVSEENNVLSDFKGIVNTKILTDQVTINDWRTSEAIENSSSEGNYPAACCCARFKTAGTKAFVDCSIEELRHGTGFWYLPAMGELGYMAPRAADINDTITKLKKYYDKGLPLDRHTIPDYWSSSEHSSNKAYFLSSTCYVSTEEKNNDHNIVRAFMRL